jgi:hypothetical protein
MTRRRDRRAADRHSEHKVRGPLLVPRTRPEFLGRPDHSAPSSVTLRVGDHDLAEVSPTLQMPKCVLDAIHGEPGVDDRLDSVLVHSVHQLLEVLPRAGLDTVDGHVLLHEPVRVNVRRDTADQPDERDRAPKLQASKETLRLSPPTVSTTMSTPRP